MRIKHLNKISIAFITLVAFFFGMQNLKAEDTCGSDYFYCVYSVEKSKVKIKVDLKLEQANTVYSNSVCTSISSLKISDFSSGSGTYRCPSAIGYIKSTSNEFDCTYNFTNSSSSSSKKSNIISGESCNKTISYKSTSGSVECGKYYSKNNDNYLSVTRNNSSWVLVFSYLDGTGDRKTTPFTGKININTSNVDTNGCPKEICYGYTINGQYASYSSSNNYSCATRTKNSVTTTEELAEEADDKDGWDTISASDSGILQMLNGKIDCEGALGDALGVLQEVFMIIKVGAVILTVVLSALDFMKAITSDKDNLINAAFSTVIKRIIVLVCVILLPSLVNLIISLISIGNGTCGIS